MEPPPFLNGDLFVVFMNSVHKEELCSETKRLPPFLNGMVPPLRNGIKPQLTNGVNFMSKRDLGRRWMSTNNLSLPVDNTITGKLQALRNKSQDNPNFIHFGLIGLISDPELLVLAYELIKSKQGNMTPGPDNITLDKLNLAWVHSVSKQIQTGKFQFKPALRVKIPKPGQPGQTRPLGIASPREKIVQKAIQLVLEAIYEPIFTDSSHGFRTGRSCHTALKSCTHKLIGVKWVIEGDISKCFDTIPHEKLMIVLRKHIGCDKTLTLISRALQAGYFEMGEITHNIVEGTPQGSVMSPILCNIFLHEFDIFIAELINGFNSGKVRRKHQIYRQVARQLEIARKNHDVKKVRTLRTQLWKLPSGDPLDPNYRRCIYIRYADDFIIGVIGSKKDTMTILEKARSFLSEHLGLHLNMEKTKVTHFPTQTIYFLGADLKGCKHLKGSYIVPFQKSGRYMFYSAPLNLRLEAPILKIFNKLVTAGFYRKVDSKFKPTRVGRLINLDMPDILRYYNSIIYGYLNYYTFADNRSSLGMIIHGLKHSCALTLKMKFKLPSRAKVFHKFGSNLTYTEVLTDSKGKMTEKKYQLRIPSDFKRLPFHERFTTQEVNLPNVHKVWNNKLTRSNLFKTCIICGSTPVEMHHLRKIKNLKNTKRKLDFLTTQMIAINRKQVPLCKTHHDKVHGKLGGLTETECIMFKEGCCNLLSQKVKNKNYFHSFMNGTGSI
jgi:group II intron reverse transcriptase/maturase